MEGSRRQFVLETEGHCLVCLKLPPPPPDGGNSLEHDKEEEGDGDGPPSTSSKLVCSLQRVSRYLKLDRGKIFKDLMAASPADLLPILEGSELKGVLCEGCSQLIGRISDVASKLEALQMRMESSLKELHDKMENTEESMAMEEFKREMMNSSNALTLLHCGIVEGLRKETLVKSSLLIKKSQQPRVLLRRTNLEVNPTAPTVEGSFKNIIPPPPAPATVTTLLGQSANDANNNAEVNLNPAIIISPHPGTSKPVPLHQCTTCNKCFSRAQLLLRHERIDHQGFRVRCDVCFKVFKDLCSLRAHRKRLHGSSSPAGLSSTQAQQQQITLSAVVVPTSKSRATFFGGGLNRSRPPPSAPPDQVSQQSGLECRICKKTYKTMRGREDHQRTFHDGLQFKCTLCPVTFTFRSNLQRHRIAFHQDGGGGGAGGSQERVSVVKNIHYCAPICDIMELKI